MAKPNARLRAKARIQTVTFLPVATAVLTLQKLSGLCKHATSSARKDAGQRTPYPLTSIRPTPLEAASILCRNQLFTERNQLLEATNTALSAAQLCRPCQLLDLVVNLAPLSRKRASLVGSNVALMPVMKITAIATMAFNEGGTATAEH